MRIRKPRHDSIPSQNALPGLASIHKAFAKEQASTFPWISIALGTGQKKTATSLSGVSGTFKISDQQVSTSLNRQKCRTNRPSNQPTDGSRPAVVAEFVRITIYEYRRKLGGHVGQSLAFHAEIISNMSLHPSPTVCKAHRSVHWRRLGLDIRSRYPR